MLEHRVIPCLLLHQRGLVKTVRFKSPRYVGDAINVVRLFNEKEADELVFLDIGATRERGEPNFELIGAIATEAFMPVGYGGGISSPRHAERLYAAGIEKVILNSAALANAQLITDVASIAGSSGVVASIDVSRNLFGQCVVRSNGGSRTVKGSLTDIVRMVEDAGAGEVLLQSIDRDGTMTGYDIPLIRQAAAATSIPLIAAGGAGQSSHFREAIDAGAAAVAAGSHFIFHGKHQAVLITYPDREALRALFAK
jgi:cyclase